MILVHRSEPDPPPVVDPFALLWRNVKRRVYAGDVLMFTATTPARARRLVADHNAALEKV